MRVCVVDIDEAAAGAVADEIGGLGVGCDVSNSQEVDAAFASCVDELGSLDLAFLNAGISVRWSGDIAALEDADYRRSLGSEPRRRCLRRQGRRPHDAGLSRHR